ncbi:MAG: hypothetical protein CMH23_07075 [Methylophaga sp.]|uniref:hypothetical protein n=1 Tax=Methylophaga sp. TaxID=2024840 RepID=UPI000C9172C0|nr:hypothetical protein [Methylophaga sp.]MBN46220.1 hypothetical protein [Methylophaga sp.]QDP56581.1 MAG: hypothetical protein GOVbin2380_16 [Prokaryotic dsDNA virus sp.]|tara:strand:- start:21400 stop:21993 length:594 start_codon:yes stop_codon:yes gene_type:complete
MAEEELHLKHQIPKVGRRIRENAQLWNEADWGFLQDLNDPRGHVFRKRGFFWSHLRENVANGDVYYYSVVTSSTKHTIIYTRDLSAGEGPVKLENIIGATYTPGTAIAPINLFAGGPSCDLAITAGATGVSGGVTVPVDFLFGAGNKAAVAGSAGLPTIFPPNTTLVLKLTNEAVGTNPGIKLALAFAEIVIPDDLV